MVCFGAEIGEQVDSGTSVMMQGDVMQLNLESVAKTQCYFYSIIFLFVGYTARARGLKIVDLQITGI